MRDVLAVNAVGLTKRYGDLTAVNALTMQVAQGEVYGVLGPNGAGKTTFLRMLFGLIRPDSGTLGILGRSWTTHGVTALDGAAAYVSATGPCRVRGPHASAPPPPLPATRTFPSWTERPTGLAPAGIRDMR